MSGAELNAVVTPDSLLIGRSPKAADLVCSWDSKMSRRHGRVWLEGSSNGSWMGQTRLADKTALSQQPVLLGETVLSLTQEVEAPTVEDGMTLQLRQRVSRQDFAGALETARREARDQGVPALIHLITSAEDIAPNRTISGMRKG